MTIGVVRVAFLTASEVWVLIETITSSLRRANSSASSLNRSFVAPGEPPLNREIPSILVAELTQSLSLY